MKRTRSRLQDAAALAAMLLAFVAAPSACGGGGVSSGDGVDFEQVSVDGLNAKAVPAVAYESGAALVEALKQAGVPCTKHTVSPVTVATAVGRIHVADSVQCDYSEGDYIGATVAWPQEFSSHYFSSYFESFMQAGADTGSESLALKGELWFAKSPLDQRLFDTQAALGGQLCAPEACLVLAGAVVQR